MSGPLLNPRSTEASTQVFITFICQYSNLSERKSITVNTFASKMDILFVPDMSNLITSNTKINEYTTDI